MLRMAAQVESQEARRPDDEHEASQRAEQHLQAAQGIGRDAAKQVAKETGYRKGELYRLALESD